MSASIQTQLAYAHHYHIIFCPQSKRPRRKSKTPKKSFFSWLSCNKGKSKDVVGRPETNTLLGEPSTGLGAQNAQFTIKKKKRYVSCLFLSFVLSILFAQMHIYMNIQ